uniref:Uncharacterized protein n=1 Tax=Anguilla anguilla TaxID=7936 RepID=A0A0E9RB14_ANGAN
MNCSASRMNKLTLHLSLLHYLTVHNHSPSLTGPLCQHKGMYR